MEALQVSGLRQRNFATLVTQVKKALRRSVRQRACLIFVLVANGLDLAASKRQQNRIESQQEEGRRQQNHHAHCGHHWLHQQ